MEISQGQKYMFQAYVTPRYVMGEGRRGEGEKLGWQRGPHKWQVPLLVGAWCLMPSFCQNIAMVFPEGNLPESDWTLNTPVCTRFCFLKSWLAFYELVSRKAYLLWAEHLGLPGTTPWKPQEFLLGPGFFYLVCSMENQSSRTGAFCRDSGNLILIPAPVFLLTYPRAVQCWEQDLWRSILPYSQGNSCRF